ncbi:MAG: GNAT family N-acetyltransferase [Planctomycetaceae bacterium]
MVDDVERLHHGLRTAFERVSGLVDGAEWREHRGCSSLSYPSVPVTLFNGVWPVGVDVPADAEAAADVATAVQAVEDRGGPCGVFTIEGRHPAVARAARTLGLTDEERIPGMVATTSSFRPAHDAGLRFVVVDDDASIQTAWRVTCAGFEAPDELFRPFFQRRLLDPGVRLWLAYDGDEAVSTALGFALDGATGVFNVATPPPHRRKGYGAAVTSHAVRDGFERGSSFAFLQSSSIGHPVYRALGFDDVATYLVLSRPGD